MRMTASMSTLNFRRIHFQRQQREYDVTASWAPYHKHYVIRSFPPERSEGSPPSTTDLTRPPAVTDRQTATKKTVPWLSTVVQVVSGMFYSVVAHRRRPNLCVIVARGNGKGGVLIIIHGRSRMTIDPRTPTMPAGSTSGFTDQEDIVCTKREAP